MEKTNAHVKVAAVKQSGNEEFGMKEKTLWFVSIETPQGKLQMNIGEKSHKTLQEILTPREKETTINVLPDSSKTSKTK